MILSKRVASIQPSVTLAMTARAKKMQQEGLDVVSFGAGEPDCNTPDYIILAAQKAMQNGLTKYTASSGILPLRKAICQKLKEQNGLEYLPAQIIISCGAKHSLYNIMHALLEQGDEVIIPAPYWVSYPDLVRLAGGVPVVVPTKAQNSFKITAQELQGAITGKTKLFILNSPNNPTGAVYSQGELKELAQVLLKSGITVICDEVYEEFVYDGQKHHSILSIEPRLYEQAVVVNAFSKTYSMTGWRIGYLAAPMALAAAIDNAQSHMTSNAPTISQYAALEAISNREQSAEFIKNMRATFDERRKYALERIGEIGLSCIEPKGAFYIMLDVRPLYGLRVAEKALESSLDVCNALLENALVSAIAGEAFGAQGFLRLSYAVDKSTLKKGLDRIESFVKQNGK